MIARELRGTFSLVAPSAGSPAAEAQVRRQRKRFRAMSYVGVDDLKVALVKRLAEPGYSRTYDSESAFESVVWNRVVKLLSEAGQDPASFCLTSHEDNRGRSAATWKVFCREDGGPDVRVLGSNSRLDIVVKHPDGGTVGIEVKCLGGRRHAAKLTQGLGQAMLGLAHRDHTVLIMHCGTVKTEDRERLRTVANKISHGSKISIVVVP